MAFKKTVDYCKSKGLVVIGDVKRGDIGSTSAAYAVGHLGQVQVAAKNVMPVLTKTLQRSIHIWDLTVSIRLSMYVKKRRRVLFILVKTSNPSSGEFQDRLIDGTIRCMSWWARR